MVEVLLGVDDQQGVGRPGNGRVAVNGGRGQGVRPGVNNQRMALADTNTGFADSR